MIFKKPVFSTQKNQTSSCGVGFYALSITLTEFRGEQSSRHKEALMNGLIKELLFLILYVGVLTALPLPAFSAQSNPLDPYIEGAKKEGSVSLGLTLREKSHGKPAGELYLAAFQKRYPFLKVNFKRVGGAQERERILTEMTAGIVDFDVITVSETMVNTIVSAKLPRAVEWQKLGVPKFLVHPQNIGVAQRPPVYGIGYNRDIIPDEVAKTFTWETCTDPKWKGKTAMDDRPRRLELLYLDNGWGRTRENFRLRETLGSQQTGLRSGAINGNREAYDRHVRHDLRAAPPTGGRYPG